MAFVLVATFIFFALVGLVYFSLSLANLREKAQTLADNEARETIKTLAGSPELTFTSSSDCSSCIDLDKAIILKELPAYQSLLNLDYLMIEKLYPNSTSRECTALNYPDCDKITIINKGNIRASSAFVTLVRWDSSIGSFRYELGRIHASGKNLTG
ncbi:hypothetical protein HYV50_01935 [Candidatus Pacearchaeota archaeon]|nr:hypothetical protein [Candidatus Pacearchaeota archaeon]